MAAPAPETKPKSRTSTTASMFDTFEVLIAPPGSAPSSFTPRPRMAYSQADAVLALAETLKTHNILPDEFLGALGDATMSIAQVRLLECDDRYFEFLRIPANSTMEVIVTRLRDYYPGASRGHVGQALPVAEPAAEEVQEQMTFGNSGAQHGTPGTNAAPKAAKVRKVTTIYGGGDSTSKSEQLAAVAAQLTPEMVSKGVVLVMGKHGPKLLNTSGGRTEEEEGEALADAEASGEDYTQEEGAGRVVLDIPEEAAPEPPRAPALAIRTMSGAEAERSLRVSAVDHHDQEGPDALELQDLDQSIRTHLGIPRQASADPEVRLAPVVVDATSESAVGEMTQVEEVGGRRVKRQEITKRDRGGARPQRPKA